MNEYDNDNDELDDYSSGNSFRARSNTWPLNRPDLAAPSSTVCIDETLPEIELEEEDLFTTNENWSAGFVDHDIMSWDPILNAQNQHHHQQHQSSHQPAIIHHQPQQITSNHSQAHQLAASHGHHRQQSVHLTHSQQHPNHPQHLQPHCHQHEQQRSPSSHHQPQQAHDLFLAGGGPTELMINIQTTPQQQPQQQQQISPNTNAQHEPRLHQTLNSSHCLDDDPNEYHISQLHQLRLDGPNDPQQEHHPSNNDAAETTSQLSSVCIASNSSNANAGEYIPPAPHHQQSHLQPLTSARYDYDPHTQAPQQHNHHQAHQQHHHQQQNDYDIKLAQDDNLSNHQGQHHHLDHHPHAQQHNEQQLNNHHLHHEMHINHQPHHHSHSHHQYHDLTSSSLETDNGSHMLSSSLSTSGIGLSADLEDLDYKPDISPHFNDTTIQQSHQTLLQPQSKLQSNSSETVKSENQPSSSASRGNKQTDSTNVPKSKLNAPRRNAWGNMSYADLISQAIESTSDKRLTLAQIYDWMVQHVPYFKDKGDSNSSAGWKNSVRHNLSLHSRFKRLQNEGTGKSSWWTINPEANIGKCARRRAASMEASKYEKKRGRAKKKAEAIRQGLLSYPSLTNSSLNGSTSTLGEQSLTQSLGQFRVPSTSVQGGAEGLQQQQSKPQDHGLRSLDQFSDHHQRQAPQQQPSTITQLQIRTLENYNIDHPSQQQQQQLRQLQQADKQDQQQRRLQQQEQEYEDNLDLQNDVQHHGYSPTQQVSLQAADQEGTRQLTVTRFHDNNDSKLQQQQQQAQQQSQYYYQQFELSTAL